jgi:hypothetical protein
MRLRLIVAVLAVLAAGAAGIWFLHNFDRVPVRQWTGYTGEARRNPFLALERLAQRMGGSAAELRTVAQLGDLPTNGILLLPAPRDNVSEGDRRRLLAWVAAGGRLVVEAEPAGREDAVLTSVGIQRANMAPPAKPLGQGGKATAPAYLWPGDAEPLRANLLPSPALGHPKPAMALAWNGQNAVLAVAHGKGRITAVSSLGFARNRAIGAAQHATLAWRLLDRGDGPIAILNRPERLSLARWLIQNAWPVLAGGALLLALWLARIVPRFGPLAPDAPPTRRRLLDHLLAVGRFHWSTRRAAHLVEAAREGALRRLSRLRPDFAAGSPREREAYLVQSLGLTAEEARTVVTGSVNARSQSELVRAVALFQTVHERAAARRI